MLEGIAKVLDAFAHLIASLAWPAVIVWLAYWFSGSINELLEGLSEFSFKGFGAEVSAKRERVATALQAAQKVREIRQVSGIFPDALSYVSMDVPVLTDSGLKALNRSKILWVDDHPENNTFERLAFENAGAKISIARNTDQALQDNISSRFDAIVSDMSRPPDERAGLTLLRKLGSDRPPYVIYTGSKAYDVDQAVKEQGGIGATDDPRTLVKAVANAIAERKRR